MSRSIPGTVKVIGREFMYIETFGEESFSTLLEEEEQLDSSIPLPQSGGAIEEKAKLRLGDGGALMAISYKGDLENWRNRFIACCQKSRRRWGIPNEGVMTLSDGTKVELVEGEVVFEA